MTQPSDTPSHRYTAALAEQLENKWQQRWELDGTFVTPNPGQLGFDSAKPKFYCLDMFPYPSGSGLHVGHPEGYTATDIVCRYKRAKGFNVLHPMGWDAFGLPAEQYAIQTGIHPSITTRKAIETFRRQLKRFGFSYDWSREFATIDPDYYKWTQWIFLRLYNAWYDTQSREGEAPGGRARPIAELIAELERGVYGIDPSGDLVATGGSNPAILGGEPIGVRLWHELSQADRRAFIDSKRLAYVAEQTVNWCPKLGTALANEEVKADGRSERGDYPVFKKKLRQWMFRITAYAERLLNDLATLDWPESTRTMQTEWIGRSEGAEIDFALDGWDGSVRVYTTRPDTMFGATYMVIAPEHPLVESILKHPPKKADARAIAAYVHAAGSKAEVDRMAEGKEKTGVFSGLYAVNPATGKSIPVWIADYVLMGYGHGAIMAVPAHDERDFEFAAKFGLPIRDVLYPRAVLAMKYFAEHAADGPEWAPTLADFLAHVIARNTPPAEFGQVLEMTATQRRRTEAPSCLLDPTTLGPAEVPGLRHERRGVAALTWADAIESLGFRTLADLRERFARAAFQAESGAAFGGEGLAVNSSNEAVSLDGLSTDRAKDKIIAWLEEESIGRRKVNYKLRDWLFSRQRYWGEPFPIVFDADGDHFPVSESALPVLLPEMKEYKPVESDDPQPMLAGAGAWLRTTTGAAGVDSRTLPPETLVRREANTMPNWAGSCWYYLRYCDPKNGARFVGAEAEKYWMGASGVDLYIGGSEHAVLHLLYARFWHKVLFDLGEVSTAEPMRKLFHQGLITSYAYQRADKSLVPTDQVKEIAEGKFIETATGLPVVQVIAKMSKSLKNVVNPDDVIAEFGADTMRLYEMYMGPLEASKPWNPRDIVGQYKFLQRAWRTIIDEGTGQPKLGAAADEKVERELHRTIARVGPQIEKLAFNTAIADLIKFVNAVPAGEGAAGLTKSQAERFAQILAPFAPHMAEELWSRLGHAASLAYEPWPQFDPAMLHDSSIEIPVQVLGKLRSRITVPAGSDNKFLEAAALADPKIKELIEGKKIAKVIVIPGKLVNIVAN